MTDYRRILELIADAESSSRLMPSCTAMAGRIGLPGRGRDVWRALNELRGIGWVSNVPVFYRDPSVSLCLTVAGWTTIGRQLPIDLPPLCPEGRTGRVVEILWRCVECAAAVLDVKKPCAMCRIGAGIATPVWFEPNKGAA